MYELPKLPKGARWRIHKHESYYRDHRGDYLVAIQERKWGRWSMIADRFLSNLRDETIEVKADECYRAYSQLLDRRALESRRLGNYPPKRFATND